ncbi:acyl-CoA-binding domain-containing protein 6-like isoform X2 [Nasonia vitripennis]|uniref:Acyl-CoA-binding domain-containing protein 6 n=1 Tax=Nasonia vitripennis TaxID=7425 RepID=A0A7M7QZ88_NASVI|nr:acyl-CoA-binding domain-containing protein 6-like isoform X2 [Nasonia vitripennis]
MAENLDLEAVATELEETFSNAASHLQSLASELDTGQLLGFYGLYKQATCGPCDTPAPSWYQMQAKHKWEAWKSLGDMSKEVAMASYIRAVGKLDPFWEKDARTVESKAWVVVSRLPNTDTELKDIDKTLLDWVKDCNQEKVRIFLSQGPDDNRKKELYVKDENGMLPIHWAADRGDLEIFKCLAHAGSDVNAKDEDGQTPLHYAASCGHKEIVKYLLSLNVELIKDDSGMSPKDVADETLSSMF